MVRPKLALAGSPSRIWRFHQPASSAWPSAISRSRQSPLNRAETFHEGLRPMSSLPPVVGIEGCHWPAPPIERFVTSQLVYFVSDVLAGMTTAGSYFGTSLVCARYATLW